MKKSPGRKERRQLYAKNRRADSKQKSQANERRQKNTKEVPHGS